MDVRWVLVEATQWLLLACAVLSLPRLFIGPRTADRLVVLNVLAALILAFLVLQGVSSGRAIYLDVALVYDIFGFLGLLAITRFLRDRNMGGDA